MLDHIEKPNHVFIYGKVMYIDPLQICISRLPFSTLVSFSFLHMQFQALEPSESEDLTLELQKLALDFSKRIGNCALILEINGCKQNNE